MARNTLEQWRAVADAINGNLNWSNTPEGDTFWSHIHGICLGHGNGDNTPYAYYEGPPHIPDGVNIPPSRFIIRTGDDIQIHTKSPKRVANGWKFPEDNELLTTMKYSDFVAMFSKEFEDTQCATISLPR